MRNEPRVVMENHDAANDVLRQGGFVVAGGTEIHVEAFAPKAVIVPQ